MPLTPALSRSTGRGGKRLVDSDKPLFGGAEDDGLFAAPVVRIAVHHRFFGQKQIALLELIDDKGIGFPDGFVVEPLRRGVVEAAVGEDGAVDVELLADAGFVVIFAVAGGGVNEAGAVGGGD